MPIAVKSAAGSYDRGRYRLWLMVCVPLVPMNSVWPSPWARAASAPARLPPAPGLFSTTTGCPSTVLRCSANSRAERSALPPAGNGTKMATVLLGQVSDDVLEDVLDAGSAQ